MSKPFYITTPIYYVNDKPHIGHAYTTILADVIAQYHRLLGDEVFFLTGTDEHGQKVQEAAQKAGMTPKKQADTTVVRFQALWEKLEITHDDFIRTTEGRHAKIVQLILQILFDEGEIYKDEYTGWYCVSEERFFTEKELVDGKSPDGKEVEEVTETNYFFKMSKYQDWLVEYINEHPEFIQPDFRRNETLGFLKQPLGDLCISRPKSRLSWGIELPFDKDFVTYVWFDALVNYISAPGYGADKERFEKWWPADYHLIGKDILTTHTVYWPTMLKAMDVPMPKTIFAHGWWLSGSEKMSKSVGNVADPMDYIEEFGADAFRYFLMSEMVLGQDANFTDEVFVKRYHADLSNDLGNLATRVLKMIAANCDNQVPDPSGAEAGEAEVALRQTAAAAVGKTRDAIRAMRPDLGVAEVIAAVRATNRYFDHKKPWAQAKDEDQGPLRLTLYTAAEMLRVVSALLHPVMPGKMDELRAGLGLSGGKPEIEKADEWGVLQPGAAIHPVILFPKVERKEKPPAETESKPKKNKAVGKADVPEGVQVMDQITFDEFQKVNLRTAKVVEAEKVEGADKLLRLEVFVGDERRQIVAGIAQHYEPDSLIGKTIVIVANLKPAKIFGIESQGMLLAARTDNRLKLVTVDGELISGAEVG